MQTDEQEYLDWYTRINDTVGEPFDPTLFVQLAREQWSDLGRGEVILGTHDRFEAALAAHLEHVVEPVADRFAQLAERRRLDRGRCQRGSGAERVVASTQRALELALEDLDSWVKRRSAA